MAKFLGNVKTPHYDLMVANLINKFKTIGCHSTSCTTIFTFFLKNAVDVTEDQRERFYPGHKRDGDKIPVTVNKKGGHFT